MSSIIIGGLQKLNMLPVGWRCGSTPTYYIDVGVSKLSRPKSRKNIVKTKQDLDRIRLWIRVEETSKDSPIGDTTHIPSEWWIDPIKGQQQHKQKRAKRIKEPPAKT